MYKEVNYRDALVCTKNFPFAYTQLTQASILNRLRIENVEHIESTCKILFMKWFK